MLLSSSVMWNVKSSHRSVSLWSHLTQVSSAEGHTHAMNFTLPFPAAWFAAWCSGLSPALTFCDPAAAGQAWPSAAVTSLLCHISVVSHPSALEGSFCSGCMLLSYLLHHSALFGNIVLYKKFYILEEKELYISGCWRSLAGRSFGLSSKVHWS